MKKISYFDSEFEDWWDSLLTKFWNNSMCNSGPCSEDLTRLINHINSFGYNINVIIDNDAKDWRSDRLYILMPEKEFLFLSLKMS